MVGYQAPPLDGIWATAPYLHNGSVPTLATLLKSSDRPSRFYRPPSTDFAHYDAEHVGWKFERPSDTEARATSDRSGPRSLFDASRFGMGNGGHTFGDALSDEDRSKADRIPQDALKRSGLFDTGKSNEKPKPARLSNLAGPLSLFSEAPIKVRSFRISTGRPR